MIAYRRESPETLQQYIDRCFRLVFSQIASSDYNVSLMGLGAFEVLYQFCRTFDQDSKFMHTLMFKKALQLQRVARHVFITKITEEYKKELDEFKDLKDRGEPLGK